MNDKELNNITIPRMSTEDRDNLINEHKKQNERLVAMWRNPAKFRGSLTAEEALKELEGLSDE